MHECKNRDKVAVDNQAHDSSSPLVTSHKVRPRPRNAILVFSKRLFMGGIRGLEQVAVADEARKACPGETTLNL